MVELGAVGSEGGLQQGDAPTLCHCSASHMCLGPQWIHIWTNGTRVIPDVAVADYKASLRLSAAPATTLTRPKAYLDVTRLLQSTNVPEAEKAWVACRTTPRRYAVS